MSTSTIGVGFHAISTSNKPFPFLARNANAMKLLIELWRYEIDEWSLVPTEEVTML